ncbi:glycosyltransferase family 4 protein [Curtobacterium sp. 'Ferrero']|uniref:glycosyltransferase family 4 protein n=1 Tax=Curtobacterium sp. 'Ferrero' TaxID=2033654 RepID=UPI001596787C|nr:glycosyltransferase family 4 protein [Curtobacterium sp. 'Ferrero']
MAEKTITYVASTEYDGGAERHIKRLAETVQPDWTVSLLGHLEASRGALRTLGTYALGGKWVTRNLPLAFVRLPFERRKALRAAKESPSLIYHMHFKREQIGFSRAFSRLGSVIWTEHGVFPERLFGLILRPFYRRASRHVDTIACVSEKVRDSLTVVLGSDKKLIVIPNAIDVARYKEARLEERDAARMNFSFPSERRVALVIGRLAAAKRPALAVDAALAAGCLVLVAGSGPEEAQLLARYEQVKEVVIVGEVDDTRQLWAAADVHLFLSNGEGEGLPTVLLEAAASSVPSVAAVDGGFGELAVSLGGIVADPTVQAIASAIKASEVLTIDQNVLREYDLVSWRLRHLQMYEKAVRDVKYE